MQHVETCSLIAEGDRVLRHLVMFLTVFFYWVYKMTSSCYQESSVFHGWKSEFGWNRFQKSVYSLALLRGVRGLKVSSDSGLT